jgi:hypothetical protein
MASIYDELEGLLGAEAVEKVKSSPLAERIRVGADDLYNFYTGESSDPPPPRQQTQPQPVTPPVRQPQPALGGELDAIMQRLDKIPTAEAVKTMVDEAITARGKELANSVSNRATNVTLDVIKADRKHRAEFGEELDIDGLNAFAEEKKKTGRVYASVDDAYMDFTAEKRVSKRVEDGVREGLKQRSSQQNVPGFTPPSSRAPHVLIMSKNKFAQSGAGAGEAVSKAAQELSARWSGRASGE